jgi:hypothetical protein
MGGMAKANSARFIKALKEAGLVKEDNMQQPVQQEVPLEDEDAKKKKKKAGLEGKTKRTGGAGKFGETILG